jgi:RNA polymerase sigma-70 factor (family 1)
MSYLSSEGEILRGVAAGEKQAFQQVYEQYAGELYRYIYLFIRSKEETEDILQNVFTNIWLRNDTLQEVTSLRAYLFRASRNQVLNYFRNAKVKMRVHQHLATGEGRNMDDLNEQLLFKQYYAIAKDAIDKLPTRRKEVFKLNLEQGLDMHQIALQLGISTSAVKQHLYAASDFIRNYLQKHGEITVTLLVFLTLFEP